MWGGKSARDSARARARRGIGANVGQSPANCASGQPTLTSVYRWLKRAVSTRHAAGAAVTAQFARSHFAGDLACAIVSACQTPGIQSASVRAWFNGLQGRARDARTDAAGRRIEPLTAHHVAHHLALALRIRALPLRHTHRHRHRHTDTRSTVVLSPAQRSPAAPETHVGRAAPAGRHRCPRYSSTR